MDSKNIAYVCHEAMRALCVSWDDHHILHWNDAEQWQRECTVELVDYIIANPLMNAIDFHGIWMDNKIKNGWVYGPFLDSDRKWHDCIRPYHELPEKQKIKDRLFVTIVRTLSK